MKKNLFLVAAAAIAFAACSNEEILVENGQQTGSEKAIGFTTYAGKATRADQAENSKETYTLDLKDHHTDFVVWGYKNTSTTLVFDKQLVEWDGTNSVWDYTPHRYWDKAADKYEFYAAAPKAANNADLGWTLNAGTTQADSYITLPGVKLVGSNLSNVEANGVAYKESFASAPSVTVGTGESAVSSKDIDLMIADKKPVTTANFTDDAVELDFIHILSRLNVTIQTTVKSPAVVTLKSLEVVGLINGGDFSEATAANADGSIARWTRGEEKYTLAAKTDYTVLNVDTKDKYVLQALVIPQEAGLENIKLDGTAATVGTTTYVATTAATAPYIKIVYTIDPDGAGTAAPAEEFIAYYNLATVFGVTGENKLAFYEGWMNTLNVTIAPTAIKFTGKVAKWDESANKDLKVE